MTQPEALRLADRLRRVMPQFITSADLDEVAAELRRLHEAQVLAQVLQARLDEALEQRGALLEALKAAVADWDEEVSRGRWLDAARAAIAKAEEA